MLLKNKKGATAIAILLLVVISLVLTGVALFSFNTGERKIESKISSARFAESAYSAEEKIKFVLDELAEQVLQEKGLDKENFKENLIEKSKAYVFDDDLKIIQEKIREGDFAYLPEENKIILKAEIEKKTEGIVILYKTDITVTLDK